MAGKLHFTEIEQFVVEEFVENIRIKWLNKTFVDGKITVEMD